jgi:hypothetical protein
LTGRDKERKSGKILYLILGKRKRQDKKEKGETEEK